MTESNKQQLSFEEAFRRLETIVQTLEKGESTLDESIKAFEEGMKLVKFCSEKLNEAEVRLQRLVKNGEFHLESIE